KESEGLKRKSYTLPRKDRDRPIPRQTIPFRCRRGDDRATELSFLFRMASTAGVVLSIKDSFLALPTKTGDRALEEVEKNISSLRQVLSGDGEAGANQEQVLQIALEICKEGVLSLFVQNLPSLGWGVCRLSTKCVHLCFFIYYYLRPILIDAQTDVSRWGRASITQVLNSLALNCR
uniref:Uncharacterized protein n=1 Tax=Aegilops tauschii subsp. strangulata TaxID=200361 RepID=A0A453FUC0_AEGTS